MGIDSHSSILGKAEELENKYEWLQAAEFYRKAYELARKAKDTLKLAELWAKMGFCYCKAALQADTPEQFQSRMRESQKAYQASLDFLLKSPGREMNPMTCHSKAMVAYTGLWFAKDMLEKRTLSDEWWNLKNEALGIHEKANDLLAVGKTCNDLMQGSHDQRIFDALDWLEFTKIAEQCFCLGEKAIAVLLEVGNEYELARAYCWTSWYYSFFVSTSGYTKLRKGFAEKSLEYSNKALDLSRKIGDAYLIGWTSNAAGLAALVFEGNHKLTIELNAETQKQSDITKDNIQMAVAYAYAGSFSGLAFLEENPDRQREIFEKSAIGGLNSIRHLKVAGWHPLIHVSYGIRAINLAYLAYAETEIETKRALLNEAVAEGMEFVEHARGHPNIYDYVTSHALSQVLYGLSKIETNVIEKRRILKEALEQERKANARLQLVLPFLHVRSEGQYDLASMLFELAKIEPNRENRDQLLKNAASQMEIGLELAEEYPREYSPGWKSGLYGIYYLLFGEILSQLHIHTKDQKLLCKAVAAVHCAIEILENAGVLSRAAEAYWQKAKLEDCLGENLKAADSYESASKKYKEAAEKIPQLKSFYADYAMYMRAWAKIEEARHNHSMENYDLASNKYEAAAKLHEASDSWSYLAPNYLAWSKLEKAEDLSRKENAQKAEQAFQEAYEQFSKSEECIKQKIENISSSDEKELAHCLSKASHLRRTYCEARILLEVAKLLDRQGKYLQSSKNYKETAEKIETISEELESEAESRELRLIALLCRAWQKMAQAEDQASSEYYSEAAKLFEQAKDLASTNKTRLWSLGNSNFCKGLEAQNQFQNTLEKSFHSKANKYVIQAANYYKQAGFKTASEYAKATQRLFDANLYMNSAEDEIDPAKKTRYFQLAEQLLQISAGSFIKAKQPEKSTQVQGILATVREEKVLAASLNEVMHAPSIASSTAAFIAPTPTSEFSVGLEQFQHANVQANLIADAKEVKVGESFCLAVEFINAGKEPALLTKVENFVPRGFVVVEQPEIYRLEESCLNLKGKQIAPLKLVEAKLILQPSKKGVYQLKPTVHFLDEKGQNRSLQLSSIEIRVEEVVLADRIATGTRELDSLLLGGIPQGYAVALTGPPSDERERIIKNYLEAGTGENQVTFYIASEASGLENLLEKPGFYLFLCNPEPRIKVPELPNVSRLRSKTDLTNLNIALAKTYRSLGQSLAGTKRVCLEILSDVLLDYGAKTTRKWLSELITDLGSKGYTILAILNRGMHPPDQATGVLDLFDGEINLCQMEDPLGCTKSIRVGKLRNQDYIKNSICLTKRALQERHIT